MAAFEISPEIQAAVDAMPPLRPEQKARLRRILSDWPPLIEASVRARHPELGAGDPAA